MQNKLHAERGFAEVTLRLTDVKVEDRLLRDIAAYNAQVEVAGRSRGPTSFWLGRLT